MSRRQVRDSIVINCKKQNGVILPTVLWIVMTCLVVTASFSTNVRTNISALTNSKDAMQLKYAARSGLYVALAQFLDERNLSARSMQEKYFEGVFDNKKVRVHVKPEGVKIAINNATETQIYGSLQRAGIDSAMANVLAQRILDWKDKDQQRRNSGMEDSEYYAQGYKYGAKDGVLEDFEELRLVKGMTESVLHKLKADFTLYPANVGSVFTLTADAIEQGNGKSGRIVAIVQLTNTTNKPYRILKWMQGYQVM